MGVFDTLKQDPWPKVVDMLTLTSDRFPTYGDRLNDLVHNREPQKLVDLLADLSHKTHIKGFLRLSEEELDQIRQDLEVVDDPNGLILAAGALSGCATGAEVMEAWDRWQCQHPREELLGVAEVAKLLGWPKNKVSTYVSRGVLPQPDYRLASGPIWTRRTIDKWRQKRLNRAIGTLIASQSGAITCMECGYRLSEAEAREAEAVVEAGQVPRCPACGK